MKAILTIFFIFSIISVNAQTNLANFRPKIEVKTLILTEIDTSIMNRYYLLTFVDSLRRYQTLSLKNEKIRAGCWQPLILGKNYTIGIVSTGDYLSNDVYLSLYGRSLSFFDKNNIEKEVLKRNEFFYISNDILELFIQQ